MSIYETFDNSNHNMDQKGPELPHLPELIDAADQTWTAVANGQEIKGYDAGIEGGAAVVRDKISPTRHTELRLAQSAEGSWSVTEALQRPTLEDEGWAGTVRESRTYYLDGSPTMYAKFQSRLENGKLIDLDPKVEHHEPVDDQTCQRLLGHLHEFLGEDEAARAPKGQGWLRWLGRK